MSRRLVSLLSMVLLAAASVSVACGGGGPSGENSASPGGSPALAVGEVAPDFTAQEADSGQVTLSEVLQDSENVVLVFYRGVF
jgi:ABC-type oligopeptide transport system substrate-binding subunit